MALIMTASLAACNGNGGDTSNDNTSTTAQLESLETQKSKYQKQLQQNIASVIKDPTAITTDGIDEKLMELQQELVSRNLTLYID